MLIGGQAVAFWAAHYNLTEYSLTSKDIDFCGDRSAALLCATRLGGSPILPGMDDHTPQSAVVTFIDDDGEKRAIDFLDNPLGLSGLEVHRSAQVFELYDAQGRCTGSQFKVMNPFHSLASRIHNTTLPTHRGPNALNQLRYSVEALRSFILEVLDDGDVRGALKLVERNHELSLESKALDVFVRYGIDVFVAPAKGHGLPPKYEQIRFPQLVAQLSRKRDRWAPHPVP